jgi:ABC-type antimicrobial peptide transport system permease subunit
MDPKEFADLMVSMMRVEEHSFDNNLKKLGYADFAKPFEISIYPKDFDSKESVISILDDYNKRMRAVDEDKVISYTDLVGTLMKSVTTIVNMISTVLIAFVAISLIVSSIMIGVITYISVLERKKEIGVLRAMGASRGNIANVFNAETVIEGFISGVLAIAVVLAVSIPVNAIVLETQDVPNVMQLPWDAALALIGISVLLTFVAGLIPSQKAAHADPVEALRSE